MDLLVLKENGINNNDRVRMDSTTNRNVSFRMYGKPLLICSRMLSSAPQSKQHHKSKFYGLL